MALEPYPIADRLTAREARGPLHVSLLVGWNLIRPEFGVTEIVSGYRSPSHALSLGREKPSQHSLGLALDIHCPNFNLWSDDAFVFLLRCGFRGIGRELHPEKLDGCAGYRGRFHIDVRPGPLAFWRYTGEGPDYVRDDAAYRVAALVLDGER